jgi:hypothetical protein
MKKIVALALIIGLFSFKHTSDEEGIFTMSHLSKLDLKKAGLEIEVDEIYNESKPALVNALVRLGGCTGSFISDQGLIITNHHCVFSSVAQVSTAESNYLKNGFYADSKDKEIKTSLPCKITQSYSDVSEAILSALPKGISALDKKSLIQTNIKALEEKEQKKYPNLVIEISEMLVGKSYTLFRYKFLDDVRLVYVPPKNIGKFGGETDNWEWPRHNGDFSIVRAYENGVPYKPESHLEVNPAGTKEGDFTFILGYPGRTYRNQTAQFYDYQNNFVLPIIADWFDYKIDAMNKYVGDDVDLQLKYSGTLASLSNVTKNFKGKMQGLQRTDVIAQAYKDQKSLQDYAQKNLEKNYYLPLFAKNDALYKRKFELSRDYLYLNQFYGTTVFNTASTIAIYGSRISQLKAEERNTFLSENKESVLIKLNAYRGVLGKEEMEQDLFAELYYRLSQSEDNEISSIFKTDKLAKGKGAIKTYAASLWAKSKIRNVDKYLSLADKKLVKALQISDPLIELANKVNSAFSNMQTEMTQINAEIDEIIPRFNDLEMEVNGGGFIPDANGTLRFTYGYIKGYEPKDGVVASPYTTVKGIIEKAERTDNPDYYLEPEYLDKLMKIEPADVLRSPVNNAVVVGLLYNMDTTGGNSGSPIMDSKGRLVGVNFDRAYTATINDYAWNESYSRSIGVDIRYVLYVMKYFGEADTVLAEMGVEL